MQWGQEMLMELVECSWLGNFWDSSRAMGLGQAARLRHAFDIRKREISVGTGNFTGTFHVSAA